ncbi:hypothetical protein Q4I30_006746 [Leishmania utingensis]|uniref:Uncharacterized protein n=1 Tax=Leishmania utingensis TaxID=653362 RepID=A0AAW3A0P2_9TRYP
MANALAPTDMIYAVSKRAWQQIPPLFPQRFCAGSAKSEAVTTTPWTMWTSSLSRHLMDKVVEDPALAVPTGSAGDVHQVLYYVGGLNSSHQLRSPFHRLWLPREVLKELPQYGAVSREQFKGILVCDVQRGRTPDERQGASARQDDSPTWIDSRVDAR